MTKNQISKELTLTDGDILTIMKSGEFEPIKAKMQPDSISGEDFEKVQITVNNFGVSKIFESFSIMWKTINIINFTYDERLRLLSK